jgi:hypothetical protein
MCLYFDGQEDMMPSGLMSNSYQDLAELIDIDKHRILLLRALSSRKLDDLAFYSIQCAVKPERLFIDNGLPSKLQLVEEANKYLEVVLSEKGFTKYEGSYISIINTLSEVERDETVTRLIVQLGKLKSIDSPRLLDYLKANYGPTKAGSRWKLLNLETQSVLRAILGSAWFSDFKDFIFQLTKPELATALNLKNSEITQLQNRVTFWSNYQSRLHSFKIFLPLKTSLIIQNFGLNLPEHTIVEGFKNHWQETEICFLEFDKYIIVEYLRGGSSSVKLYSKLNNSITTILNSQRLQMNHLDELDFIDEHDHADLWQSSCEKMLRTKYNILPDQHLKKFTIVETTLVKNYSHVTGLPPLTRNQQIRRQKALENKYKIISVNIKSKNNIEQLNMNKHNIEIGDKFIRSEGKELIVTDITKSNCKVFNSKKDIELVNMNEHNIEIGDKFISKEGKELIVTDITKNNCKVFNSLMYQTYSISTLSKLKRVI